MFALSCKSNREYRAFEICQLMDSIALQLAIKYATKSGKITLAQKITDELIEQRKDQEEKQKEIQRSSSSPPLPSSYLTSSTISISSLSTFEEIKQTTRPKVSTSNVPFNNPFRKKNLTNSTNETSTTDELSKWKPSINKSRLATSNKTTIQV
jgi:chromosome transmission fidelity protein 4